MPHLLIAATDYVWKSITNKNVEICNSHTLNILYPSNFDLNLVTCSNLYTQYTLTMS